MDTNRFDSVTKLLAANTFSRRRAVRQTVTGLIAGATVVAGLATEAAAQDATPAATGSASNQPQYLFVQSFQKGGIAPKAGADGTYELKLEQGLGHTIIFSDRPNREVGAAPTDKMLAEFAFPAADPPNAALVLDAGNGKTEFAVMELFNPVFDPGSPGVTYDVKVLKQWEKALGITFAEQPMELAAIAPEFGNASLFIDDWACGTHNITCKLYDKEIGHIPNVDYA